MAAPSPRKSLRARGAILGAIVVAMLFTSVYPLGRWYAMRQDITALERQESELIAAIAQAEADRDLLLTDVEVERLARERLGFVRPGEAPFVIITPSEDPAEGLLEQTHPAPADAEPLLDRWWRAMSKALRVS